MCSGNSQQQHSVLIFIKMLQHPTSIFLQQQRATSTSGSKQNQHCNIVCSREAKIPTSTNKKKSFQECKLCTITAWEGGDGAYKCTPKFTLGDFAGIKKNKWNFNHYCACRQSAGNTADRSPHHQWQPYPSTATSAKSALSPNSKCVQIFRWLLCLVGNLSPRNVGERKEKVERGWGWPPSGIHWNMQLVTVTNCDNAELVGNSCVFKGITFYVLLIGDSTENSKMFIYRDCILKMKFW